MTNQTADQLRMLIAEGRRLEKACEAHCSAAEYDISSEAWHKWRADNAPTLRDHIERLMQERDAALRTVNSVARIFGWMNTPPRELLESSLVEARQQFIALTAENAELTRRLTIAEKKNATSLANNLCPDHRDKQQGKPCLACSLETAERKLREAEKYYVGTSGVWINETPPAQQ